MCSDAYFLKHEHIEQSELLNLSSEKVKKNMWQKQTVLCSFGYFCRLVNACISNKSSISIIDMHEGFYECGYLL